MIEPTVADLAAWTTALGELPRDASDAERVDRIRLLEELKCAAAAAQAQTSVDLDTSQRDQQRAAGLPERRVGEGVAAQLGLARRESPHKAARLLGLAKILDTEMPHTLALMRTGRLNEWRATILARETACLARSDRAEVDRLLCSTGQAEEMSDRELENTAKKLAYRLDPESFTARARRAEADRTVTIRPAPDTMTYLTALLPVTQGVAVYAALRNAADSARTAGDQRSRGQVMADTLTSRVTGRDHATAQRLDLRLVMTDRTLLAGDHEPAHLLGYGPVPADWARDLVHRATTDAEVWLRRLWTLPDPDTLLAMDSRSRRAPDGLADLITTRDLGTCRTPWCGAPIRAIDHAVEHHSGGQTSHTNLQGLCERCNLAKQAPGWRARPSPGPTHAITTQTPTGHRHRSQAPAMPGAP